ncbi:aminomethyl-transferring glycine dehydrogenase subunit GcvPA [bacterium]|nr:aminomethyl-transferring glycine dehydrogenase subunit GcvPA [bacterium]
MRYFPHTEKEIKEMLQVVGVQSIDGLFPTIPEKYKLKNTLNLPPPLTEWELDEQMEQLAGKTAVSPEYSLFLGAGRYDHYIPSSIRYLLGRSEFSTAYTPYQPEISQGTLQGIYEFQTLITKLLEMDIATASHYDGATALAEALLISLRKSKEKKSVAVSSLVHPHYRDVVKTYFSPTEYEIVEIPFTKEGRTDLDRMDSIENLAGMALQSPNFFGVIEDLKTAGEKIHGRDGILIVSFTEALAYGILKGPGSSGADLVVGEGQSLGIPKSFGGPGLGIFASTNDLMRSIPGRLVGKTRDADGKMGFVLTLATREQHIRREKATSNICTNNGLCAMTAAMYMASTGNTGIRVIAQQNHDKAEYLKQELKSAGFTIPFDGPTFNEFIVVIPNGQNTYQRLLNKKIVAGLPIEKYYPQLKDHYLLCATETVKKSAMDDLVRELAS